jgi:hypothetical protein
MSVHGRVAISIVLGIALSAIAGATPNKVVETVEIDGKGTQTAKHHQASHEVHERRSAEVEHSHTKKVGDKDKESHETHDAKKSAAPAHKDVSHAPEAKAEEHHKIPDKEPSAEALKAGNHVPHRAFSDEEEDDAALDELEAMTIARTFEKKHVPPWGPPAAEPCTWHEWENDGSCAFTCGGRGKTGQRMTRGKTPEKHAGNPCHGKTSKQVECAIEECPTTTTTTEEATTTTAGGAPRVADLSSVALLASFIVTLFMSWSS